MRKILLITLILLLTNQLISQCVGTAGQVSWHYWENIEYHYDFDTPLDFLFEDDTYPNGPDLVRKINSVSTPYNYNDEYAAVTKGFISVPTSGFTTFNLTGDDYTVFLLSSDATSANLDTAALIEGYTGTEEYNKYEAQTSDSINLITGQYYYFEIYHKEGGGGDFAHLRWQRPFLTDSTWSSVSSPFLNDVCDSVCPTTGTPCDDSNALTIGDMEDGNCHCIGMPDTTGQQLHVGERAVLDAYLYDNTGNGNISELTDPNYPSIPSRMTKQRDGLTIHWDDDFDNYATNIKGYFTVPVSGNYDFNLTGARNVEFRFNSLGGAPITNQVISTRWGTGHADHDNDISQTVTGIFLESNTYYYMEVIQAVTSWGHFVNVFWKIPGHPDSDWHMIPEIYFYDYTNESACLPQGTVCNDGDPLTANDQINNSCDCIGTPCTPMLDCDDPAANIVVYDYCEVSNYLGSRPDDAWLSCNAGSNPYINERSGNHWIHYDLGQPYVLKGSRVWNYNINGNEDLGFQNVEVDYSENGADWVHLGTYTWLLACGDNTYTGFEGPDFGSVTARYVMITSTDGGPCRGLSKVTFTAEACAGEGIACDDGDLATVNDHFNKDCDCVGYTVSDLDCGKDTLFLNQADMPENTYHAVMALMSGGSVMNATNVNFRAGVEVIFEAGFEVDLGSTLEANIEDCASSVIAMVPTKKIDKNLSEITHPAESIKVYTTANSTIHTIRMYLPDPTQVTLEIFDIEQQSVMPIITQYFPNHGDHYKRIQTRKLPAGVYLIKMTTKNGDYLDRIVVL